jgi:HD-like signal output (HDOD) protein
MHNVDKAPLASAGNRSSSADAFEFVKSLANELSSSKIELPSFPDIAVRVQRVLADDNVTPDRVVRVLGGEPALAAKIMSMANSAALNPSGRQISDLKNAVGRLGFDMLRSAAITFAMSQLRKADQFKGIEKELNVLWQRSVTVAAYSFVIARRCTKMPPDTAMLTGLLHTVGKLYILTRASRFPSLFGDPAAYNNIVKDWHINIAKALLENWQISDVVVDAIYSHEDPSRDTRGAAALADVLAAGLVFASFREQPDLLDAGLREFRADVRMGLDRDTCARIQTESVSEINALKDALGG